ncbi:hypothetical protein LWI29_004777 [Acer saccharum]|uniref:Uncharacterized protein n=1 Tax=Acer saccharum TaxID=4024 RepID=A0AA39T9T4_ACESA|nr:hypothetical protein LWI29_004777 [Acer saccharum]
MDTSLRLLNINRYLFTTTTTTRFHKFPPRNVVVSFPTLSSRSRTPNNLSLICSYSQLGSNDMHLDGEDAVFTWNPADPQSVNVNVTNKGKTHENDDYGGFDRLAGSQNEAVEELSEVVQFQRDQCDHVRCFGQRIADLRTRTQSRQAYGVILHELQSRHDHLMVMEKIKGFVVDSGGGDPSSPQCSLITLILSCTVADGVQFGWALQLSLLTPYIQIIDYGLEACRDYPHFPGSFV